ncbi:MAG: hypothetical protein HY537_18695 [Deltaproteobacteria bacterium]|nr:hypothetical protein [Deltaproteobacteria bacterium]
MPVPVSMESNLFPFKLQWEYQSVIVPWEVEGYAQDAKSAQVEGGGIFDLSFWSVIQVSGPDAKDFLQRMSTVNFNVLVPGTIVHGAFLTGRAGVVALGMFQAVSEGYHFLVSPPQGEAVHEHLEKFHFIEKLKIEDKSQDYAVLGIWNHPDWKSETPMNVHRATSNEIEFEWWQEDVRHDLIWVKVKRRLAPSLLKALLSEGIKPLGCRLYEFFRIAAGIPLVGKEISDENIILEASFDRAIARSKGCYPGQEVVERIYTYGDVNRKLLRVSLETQADSFPNAPFELSVAEKPAGKVVSWMASSQDFRKAAGLAYIRKNFLEHDGTFASSDPLLSIRREII